MTNDKTWMHRAFPTLSPAEAEQIIEGCDGIGQLVIELLSSRAMETKQRRPPPKPPLLEAMGRWAFETAFVIGSEPLPDLTTAEYVRHALQQEAADQARMILDTMGYFARGMASRASRKLLAHRRRCLIWHFAAKDLFARDLSKQIAKLLESDSAICRKFEFPTGAQDHAARKVQKARRGSVIRNLLSEMREDHRNGRLPYTLSFDEENEIRSLAEDIRRSRETVSAK